MKKILQYVDFGKQDGAKLVTGGKRFGKEGTIRTIIMNSQVTEYLFISRLFRGTDDILRREVRDEDCTGRGVP
jgi:hypothetical protein